jgi:hypothetical protein
VYDITLLVLLPGFQKGRDIKLLKERGREQFWPKKGSLRHTRKNFQNEKNRQNFTPFRVNKIFNTFKTL